MFVNVVKVKLHNFESKSNDVFALFLSDPKTGNDPNTGDFTL
jgi:hypothetical protein